MSMVNKVAWRPRSIDPPQPSDKQNAEIMSLKEVLEQLKKQHEDKQDELQLKNVSLSV